MLTRARLYNVPAPSVLSTLMVRFGSYRLRLTLPNWSAVCDPFYCGRFLNVLLVA